MRDFDKLYTKRIATGLILAVGAIGILGCGNQNQPNGQPTDRHDVGYVPPNPGQQFQRITAYNFQYHQDGSRTFTFGGDAIPSQVTETCGADGYILRSGTTGGRTVLGHWRGGDHKVERCVEDRLIPKKLPKSLVFMYAK